MKKILILALAIFLQQAAFSREQQFYFTTSDSVRLYVHVAGEGRPCVFVHGGPGSSSYYLDVLPSARLLEQHLMMIYFDQRGCGRSSSPGSGDYSLKRMEADLEELRQYLKLRQWSVMGHSFGGIVATQYAKDFPASISRLLLIHCTLNMAYSMNSHLEFGLKELGITDQRAYRDSTKPLNERVWMVHDSLTKKGVWYKLMYRNTYEKKYNDTLSNVLGVLNHDFANAVWNVPDYWRNFTALTESIHCPVLVMTGDRDYAIGPDHYRQFRFRQARVVHYIGGHAPFQEEPQWFSEKVLDFMR